MKQIKTKKILSVFIALLCCLTIGTATVFADAAVSEPEVELPATIEIQFGPKWVGVEFQLKTDEGLYPERVPVGTDGVLRLGLSGSEKYILSCMDSAVATPSPEESQAPAESTEAETTESEVPENQKDPPSGSQEKKEAVVGGIPVQHIIMFGGGLLLAIGGLITIHILKKRHVKDSQYRDYEADEDE